MPPDAVAHGLFIMGPHPQDLNDLFFFQNGIKHPHSACPAPDQVHVQVEDHLPAAPFDIHDEPVAGA